MHIRVSAALAGLMFAAGCASAPQRQAVDIDTAYGVQLASATIETGAPVGAFVEERVSGPRPLGFYVQIALEQNPEILAARRGVAAQAETIPQVTALDDPMLTDTFWPITAHSPQTASGRMPNSLMVTQEFPWLSKLRVRGELAEQETQIALTELAQTELEVIEAVHIAYYEIYYHQRAIQITQENERLLKDLVEFADIRFQTGGSQQDVLRAELELDRLREQLIDLRRELRLAQADLAALLHASPDSAPLAMNDLRTPATPQAIEQLYELAVRCRPELQERLHAIVRDQRRRELAALEYYPDFTAGMSWDYMTTDDALAAAIADGKDNLGFIVGVDLPLWRNRLRAGVREADQRVAEASLRYEATRDDTFRQVRRLIAQADAAERQIALFRDGILPRAEQTFEVSMADYRTAKVDVQQVIENYTDLLTFRIQLVRLQTSLGQTLASLERVIGCELAALPESADPMTLPPPEPAAQFGVRRTSFTIGAPVASSPRTARRLDVLNEVGR